MRKTCAVFPQMPSGIYRIVAMRATPIDDVLNSRVSVSELGVQEFTYRYQKTGSDHGPQTVAIPPTIVILRILTIMKSPNTACVVRT